MQVLSRPVLHANSLEMEKCIILIFISIVGFCFKAACQFETNLNVNLCHSSSYKLNRYTDDFFDVRFVKLRVASFAANDSGIYFHKSIAIIDTGKNIIRINFSGREPILYTRDSSFFLDSLKVLPNSKGIYIRDGFTKVSMPINNIVMSFHYTNYTLDTISYIYKNKSYAFSLKYTNRYFLYKLKISSAFEFMDVSFTNNEPSGIYIHDYAIQKGIGFAKKQRRIFLNLVYFTVNNPGSSDFFCEKIYYYLKSGRLKRKDRHAAVICDK